MINPEQTRPISVFGVCYASAMQASDGRLILSALTDLTIIEKNGEHWNSVQISLDGLKDVNLNGNIVSGLGWDYTVKEGEEWNEFKYNIDTRKLIEN
jgi:hypothetical protein